MAYSFELRLRITRGSKVLTEQHNYGLDEDAYLAAQVEAEIGRANDEEPQPPQETQPPTCGECRVVFSSGSLGTSGSISLGFGEGQDFFKAYYVVESCPLHAQAKALLEALEQSDRDVHLLAHQGEQHRHHLDEDSYQRCVLDPCTGDRAAIAAAQPKHAAQEGEA